MEEMIGNRKLVVTTHMDLDNPYGVPMIGNSYVTRIQDACLPSNLFIGKTYYYLTTEGNLIAFKIHAYTFVQPYVTYSATLYGLIQTPTETSWRYDVFNCLIFESVDDYYTYLETGKGNIKIEKQSFNNDNSKSCFAPPFYLRKTYYWNKTSQRPKVTDTRMWRILITDTCVYVEVDYTHNQYRTEEEGFPSAEECIKHNIDGMKIVEFDDPKIVINVHIEEPKTPKVRVLKFIED